MKQRFLLLALCACTLLACDSANPLAPSGTVLSMSANPIKIGLNGQSTITVTGFKPDASPLNPGTQIILSTDRGNIFHPTTGQQISIVEIDGNGQAVARLQADGTAGDAVVTASLSTAGGGGGGGDGGGGATTGASATVTIQIGEAVEDQPTLVISANPSIVDVLEVSKIEILGRNSDNTPLSGGQRIRLTSNLGTLHATDSDTDTTVIGSVNTDGKGEASVYFRAGDQNGTGQVSAIVGTSVEETVSIEIRDAPADFSFVVDDDRIPLGGATITLTATVVNARGEAVQSTLVRFESIGVSGTFAPGPSDVTDGLGVAEVMLTLAGADLLNVTSFVVRATVTINSEPRLKDITILVE